QPVTSFDDDTNVITTSDSFATVSIGDSYKVVRSTPRWSQSNLLIPRSYSTALSILPQNAWVRSTDDPPPSIDDPNWWDPNTSPDDIEAAQNPGNDPPIHPRGGPWGSALWVMVQARFNPVGALWFFYEFTQTPADLCFGHGGDEDEGDAPPTRYTTVQGNM